MTLPSRDELIADLFFSNPESSDTCPICYELYTAPAETPCGHIFCFECAETWFKKNTNCPSCRTALCFPAIEDDGSDHEGQDEEYDGPLEGDLVHDSDSDSDDSDSDEDEDEGLDEDSREWIEERDNAEGIRFTRKYNRLTESLDVHISTSPTPAQGTIEFIIASGSREDMQLEVLVEDVVRTDSLGNVTVHPKKLFDVLKEWDECRIERGYCGGIEWRVRIWRL